MYSEKYEQRGFSCKPFLLRIILLIVLVFFIIDILPNLVKPTIITNSKNKDVYLSPLTSKVYDNNTEKMKKAALTYYTEEKLPTNIGDSSTLTLQDMKKQNLITSLTVENNNTYDETESYIKLTKIGQDYLLKINLKDNKQENYLLVHLGFYTHCDNNNICENKISKPKKQ